MDIASLLGGLSAKLYDDLYDNNILQKFRNDNFMEFLKGMQFIVNTITSIKEPFFYIIFYTANICNYLSNNDAFNEPYEYSLLYSYFLLLFFLDYKKITNINIFDWLIVICGCLGMFIEPIIMSYFFKNSEFSFPKMIIRGLFLLGSIIGHLFSTSKSIKCLLSYLIGYSLVSTLIQYYSLINDKKCENIKDKNIKDENIKDKNIKDENIKDKNIKDKNIKDKNIKDENIKDENININVNINI